MDVLGGAAGGGVWLKNGRKTKKGSFSILLIKNKKSVIKNFFVTSTNHKSSCSINCNYCTKVIALFKEMPTLL